MDNKEAIKILKELPDRIVAMIMPLDVNFDYKEALDLAIKVIAFKEEIIRMVNMGVYPEAIVEWVRESEEEDGNQ